MVAVVRMAATPTTMVAAAVAGKEGRASDKGAGHPGEGLRGHAPADVAGQEDDRGRGEGEDEEDEEAE